MAPYATPEQRAAWQRAYRQRKPEGPDARRERERRYQQRRREREDEAALLELCAWRAYRENMGRLAR